MALAEAEAGAAGDEGRMAEAVAARWRGAAAWGAYLAPPPRAGEWRAAEERAATMVREAGVAAFEAEEARGGILAAAGWKAAADRAVDKLSAQLRMVADAVEWVVEEWGTAEAERALWMEAEEAWAAEAREVEEAREAERALWMAAEREGARDGVLVRRLEMEMALAEVAAEVLAGRFQPSTTTIHRGRQGLRE